MGRRLFLQAVERNRKEEARQALKPLQAMNCTGALNRAITRSLGRDRFHSDRLVAQAHFLSLWFSVAFFQLLTLFSRPIFQGRG